MTLGREASDPTRMKAGPQRSSLLWAERIKPMSLNPGSVPILAFDLGMFESAGVNLNIKEYLGSPAALAAIQSGEAVFGQLPTLEGVRLIAELGWPGKIFWANKAEKTSSSIGFVMMSVPSINKMADLRGKRFGIGPEGDYWTPIISNMLRLNRLRREEIIWVKDLDPVQKADMLLDGKIDVMLTSIQNYIGKFEGNRKVHVLADGEELSKYRDDRPGGPSFVGVASKKMLEENGDAVERVTSVLMRAARLFSDDPDAWIDAASKRRPDVSKEKIRKLWKFFKGDWPVNGGGLDVTRLGEILESLRAKKSLGSTKSASIDRLLTTKFERRALQELGMYQT
jgi:ABC-type nitrate/sulfonate/bicarbonate transport system substrate-binding protein